MKLSKFSLIALLISCLFTINILFAQTGASFFQTDVVAATNQSQTNNQANSLIYLPIITQPHPVHLVSPAPGAQLSTLIPKFIFETEAMPDNMIGCLSYDTSPNPTDCQFGTGLPSNTTVSMEAFYNLAPDTTYYWRVGMGNDINNLTDWTEQRTFVTGPAGGVFLSPPVLVSPANNSGVNANSVTLRWNPVDGAEIYSILIYDKFGDQRYGILVPGSKTQIGSDELHWIFDRATGPQFEWSMTVRNDYAWATSSSPVWNFWTTNNPTTGKEFPPETMAWGKWQGVNVYIQTSNP